jgi:hypothetical protein
MVLNLAEHPVPVHDQDATVRHLLELDYEGLTFPYQGRDFRRIGRGPSHGQYGPT